jgi:hypothetical protein
LGIRGGRHDAVGLIQEKVDLALGRGREFAVNADHLHFRIDAIAQLSYSSIDRDPTGFD